MAATYSPLQHLQTSWDFFAAEILHDHDQWTHLSQISNIVFPLHICQKFLVLSLAPYNPTLCGVHNGELELMGRVAISFQGLNFSSL